MDKCGDCGCDIPVLKNHYHQGMPCYNCEEYRCKLCEKCFDKLYDYYTNWEGKYANDGINFMQYYRIVNPPGIICNKCITQRNRDKIIGELLNERAV